MVQLFVHFVTSHVFGEGTKRDVRCFTCPWFRKNILTHPGTAVVILMFPTILFLSIHYFMFGIFFTHWIHT